MGYEMWVVSYFEIKYLHNHRERHETRALRYVSLWSVVHKPN